MTIHAKDHALKQYNGAFWKVETVKTLLTSLIFLIQILNTTSKMNLRPFQQIFGTLFVLFLVKSYYFRRQKQLNKNFHRIFFTFFQLKILPELAGPTVGVELLWTKFLEHFLWLWRTSCVCTAVYTNRSDLRSSAIRTQTLHINNPLMRLESGLIALNSNLT